MASPRGWDSSQQGVWIISASVERENSTRWNDSGFYGVASKVKSHCFQPIVVIKAATSSREEKIVSTT